MPRLDLFQRLLTFKEPRIEPGFLLAHEGVNEPRPEERTDFPAGPPSGDLRRDLEAFRRAFGRNNQLLRWEILPTSRGEMAYLFLRGAAKAGTARELFLPLLSAYEAGGPEGLARSFPDGKTKPGHDLAEAVDALARGWTLLLFQGEKRFLMVETEKKVSRPVGRAVNERVVRGPQEGFTEDLEENLTLVRQRLRTPRLAAISVTVGALSGTECLLLYLEGITNPRLVEEVRRRVEGLRLDFLSDSGALEILIEDNPLHPYPQLLSTERPDRVAAALAEGKVAILVDGSPQAMVLPATVLGLLHAAEDYNVRWPYGIFMRLIRVLAVFVLLFLSPLYIAANLYQPEILPSGILLTLVSFKRATPLPTVIEIVILEFFLELLREAGLRGPQTLAPALTIVIGVFLGLATFSARLINPVLLLVVALSALAALTIPDFSTALSFRLTRYFYMLFTSFFGYIGIALGAYLHLHLLVKQGSFGVPMMVPIAPFTRRGRDVVLMGPPWMRERRPDFLQSLRSFRAPKITQVWREEQEERPRPPEGGEDG
ncbi:MAG: spore germination protein [Firmicutes bacterium]|nr:spore germination protein [Bacillota bacterium]